MWMISSACCNAFAALHAVKTVPKFFPLNANVEHWSERAQAFRFGFHSVPFKSTTSSESAVWTTYLRANAEVKYTSSFTSSSWQWKNFKMQFVQWHISHVSYVFHWSFKISLNQCFPSVSHLAAGSLSNFQRSSSSRRSSSNSGSSHLQKPSGHMLFMSQVPWFQPRAFCSSSVSMRRLLAVSSDT